METSTFMERLWDQGQRHLGAGRYVAARRDLEAAERMAWRRGDPASLARIYLPLLETRRQIRYLAVEGRIVITAPGNEGAGTGDVAAGTWVFVSSETRGAEEAVAAARAVMAAGVRASRCVEVLVVLSHGGERRLVSVAEPVFAAGVPAVFRPEGGGEVAAATDPDFVAPLPATGVYEGQAAGAGERARESLLIAWEALGLAWQRRHMIGRRRTVRGRTVAAWSELDWLREALRIDPASEPISMRLIALAELIGRTA